MSQRVLIGLNRALTAISGRYITGEASFNNVVFILRVFATIAKAEKTVVLMAQDRFDRTFVWFDPDSACRLIEI
jgi:hypothetical protein